MPLVEISHTTELTAHQQERLAEHITYAHSREFKTPSLFVNVVFKEIGQQGFFIGGKKRSANSISYHVRQGGGRATSQYDAVTKQMAADWVEVVKPKYPEDELHSIFVLATIMTGREAGFVLPPAGQDGAWLKENLAAFEQKAKDGNEDFALLLKEINERDDLKV